MPNTRGPMRPDINETTRQNKHQNETTDFNYGQNIKTVLKHLVEETNYNKISAPFEPLRFEHIFQKTQFFLCFI